MDHREFFKSLDDDERLRLQETSDRAGLLHLAAHLGVIVLLAGLVVWRVPFWPLLMLPLGVALVFLFTLLHETVHQTPFRSAWINTAVGWLCGLILFLPPNWFRHFHLAHHRHTQDPERDPELASPKPHTPGEYLWHVSGLPVWKSQIATLLRNAAGRCEDEFVPPKALGRVRSEARIMLALYLAIAVASLAGGSLAALHLWLLPMLMGQPFLRLYLLAEHGRCPMVADMFENTRTTFTTWLVRKLAWNMPYHAEHHALPNVPFHKLPELHNLTREHLKVTEDGYGRFNRKYWGWVRKRGEA